MNHISCTKTILLILSAACICPGRGNFKQGDRWEYEYYKNAYFYYGPTPYDHSTDSLIGKITVNLDSVVQRSDSTLWYLRRHDSINVWQRKGAPGGYRFITTKFTIDSTYRQIVTIGQGPDTTIQWEYSMVLAPTNISSGFVSFTRQPDTSLSWSVDSCSPVCSTTVYRKTNVGVCATSDGKSHELLTQEVNKSFTSGSKYGSDDNIVTSWSDSIGLCQKLLLNSFTYLVSEDPQKPENGSNWERLILVRHNGIATTIKPADVRVITFNRPHTQGVTKNAPVYFDLRGRRFQGESGQLPVSGIAVRLYPDGQCRLKWPTELFDI